MSPNGDPGTLDPQQAALAATVPEATLKRARRIDREYELGGIAYDSRDLQFVIQALDSLGFTPLGVDAWRSGSHGPRAFLLLEGDRDKRRWRTLCEAFSANLGEGVWHLAFVLEGS